MASAKGNTALAACWDKLMSQFSPMCFAIGMRELQELSTLDDTAAAGRTLQTFQWA